MIKESCNLIGWVRILVYNFEFCVLTFGKNTSAFSKLINLSLWTILLFLIWLYHPEHPKAVSTDHIRHNSWSHSSKSSRLGDFLTLETTSVQKIYDTSGFLAEKLMITESYKSDYARTRCIFEICVSRLR